MTAPFSVFCDECGAANLPSVSICFACRAPLVQTPATAVCAQQTIQEFVMSVAPAASTPPVEPGPGVLLRGRYKLIREIGKGGFGVVYLARDKRTRHQVAVKQINIGKLTAREVIDATDSYNREVALLPKLRHPHLPLLYDHFTDPEHWYLVLEYIEGQTLEEYLQTVAGKALPVKKVLKLGIQLCKILEYLHAYNPPIIFRDVKPANIMVTPRGKIYLIDFGIARRYHANRFKDTGPLGSPGYAAPEQYGRAQTTPRTDIYGLGATLQTLLTGEDPADATVHTPSSPSSNSRLQQKLYLLLAQMLEKESDKRPPTVRKIREALEDLPYGRWKFARSLLWGFLWGPSPYILLTLAGIFPAFAATLGSTCLAIPFFLVYFCWPLLCAVQVIVAFALLFQERKRLIGLGMLVGLVLLVLVFVLAQIPPFFLWTAWMGD